MRMLIIAIIVVVAIVNLISLFYLYLNKIRKTAEKQFQSIRKNVTRKIPM